MASIKVVLELDDKGYISRIKAADKATQDLGKNSANASAAATRGMATFAASITAVRAAATAAMAALAPLLAVGAAISAIRGAIAFSDDMADLAEATDIGVAKLLQLQQALQLAGGNGEDAATMITKLINKLDEAAGGSEQAQATLAKLGISMSDLRTLSPEAALDKTIKALASMEDPVARNALAFDVLGKRAAGINWASVAAGTASVSEENARAAANMERLAAVQDTIDRGFMQVKLAIVDLIQPFVGLIENMQKMSAVGSVLRGIWTALKVTFAVVAVVINDLIYILDTLLGGLGALWTAAGQAITGNFSEAGDTLLDFGAKAKKGFQDANKFAQQAMDMALGRGPAPSADDGATNRSISRGTNRTVENPYAGQIDAARNATQAFKDANAEALKRLQISYAQLTATDEEIKLQEQMAAITDRETAAVQKLQEQRTKIKTNTEFGRGAVAEIDRQIAAIQAQAEADRQAATVAVQSGESRKRSLEDIRAQMEVTFGGDMARRQIEQQRALNLALTNEEQRRLEAQFALNEQYEKDLYDLKQRYAGREGGIPQFELDRLNAIQLVRKAESDATLAKKREDEQSSTTFLSGWERAYAEWSRQAADTSKFGQQAFQQFQQGTEQVLAQFVMTGKLKLGDFARSMLQMFAQIAARNIFMGLFGAGGPLGAIGSLFGVGAVPGKAEGGPITGGRPYLVGERGPELIVPRSAGTVIPNHKLAMMGNNAGTTQVTYNIQAVDAPSFRQLLARDPEYLYGLTEQTRRSLPVRRRQ